MIMSTNNKGMAMKKTKSFLHPSMTNLPTQTAYAPKKSPLIEFPTSPQLILGEEILHFKHPQHVLSQVDLPDLFTCAGCKEYGSGKRFNCPQCDFQLHEFCALAPPVLKAHPLHLHHQLLFHSKPAKNGILKSKCDMCAKSTEGFTFRCNSCGYQMHPCCAMLSTDISISVHAHPLKLMPNTANSYSGIDSAAFVCGECNRRRSGRVYRCSVCENYYLHAVCAKNMINGLQANGIKGRTGKPSMLGAAGRLASQVVIEFIGGLIEGLGEGVGQVFIQSIAKGRHPPHPATSTSNINK